MKPIGLTMKHRKENPFTGRISGELMIIHQCLGCGAISVNRIAGDDDPYTIRQCIDISISDETRNQLIRRGITLFTKDDIQQIDDVLFGYDHDRI